MKQKRAYKNSYGSQSCNLFSNGFWFWFDERSNNCSLYCTSITPTPTSQPYFHQKLIFTFSSIKNASWHVQATLPTSTRIIKKSINFFVPKKCNCCKMCKQWALTFALKHCRSSSSVSFIFATKSNFQFVLCNCWSNS